MSFTMEIIIRDTINKKEEEIRELEANGGKKLKITLLKIEIMDLEKLLARGGLS